MTIIPIWQDHYTTYATDADSVRYYIMSDGVRIYEGRAYKSPGDDAIRIKLNDICAPYLSQAFDLPEAIEPAFVPVPSVKRTFTVFAEVTGAQLDEVEFYLDYSYEAPYDAITAGASDPITGEVDPRQWLVASAYDRDAVQLYVTTDAGRTLAWSEEHARQSGNAFVPLGNFPEARTLEVFGRTYTVVKVCPRFVIYYVNAFGGWDSLLVKGSTREMDNYTRSTYKRTYDNTRPRARGTVNYQNDYDKQFMLVTGWLSDDQAGRMHHLMGSTQVLLCDLNTGEWWPVVITDNSVEYKQRLTEGQPIKYTITATVAQDFTRR